MGLNKIVSLQEKKKQQQNLNPCLHSYIIKHLQIKQGVTT